jgi:hypothetical protein
MDELCTLLEANVMVRRTKDEVAFALPAKLRNKVRRREGRPREELPAGGQERGSGSGDGRGAGEMGGPLGACAARRRAPQPDAASQGAFCSPF